MLIVGNGTFKSGSTWVLNIIQKMGEFLPPPAAYQNPGWKEPSIDRTKLADFLKRIDYTSTNYLVKNHFGKLSERDLLVGRPDVYIVNIHRDVRDVVVSAYYYYHKINFIDDVPFEKFYWSMGRQVTNNVSVYNQRWNVDAPNIHTLSYEALLADFMGEIRKISAFLNLSLSEQDMDDIRQATSMESLQQKYGESSLPTEKRFFRKGIIGDWQNHLDERMLQDIERIQRQPLSYPEKIKIELTTPNKRAFLNVARARVRTILSRTLHVSR
jgi:hypothetical protein